MPLSETPSSLQLNSGDLRNILRAIKAFAVDEGFFCPTGSVQPYAATTAPTGWLLCDGTAYSRTTYVRLFNLIGTTFGAGDGSTTFNVPPLNGRVVVALDNLGGTSANRITGAWADSLGGTGGAETHTLTTAEIAAHTHIQNAHTHIQDAHTHPAAAGPFLENAAGSRTLPLTGTDLKVNSANTGSTTATNQNATAVNQNAGGGGAHNNLQPAMALGYIIKT